MKHLSLLSSSVALASALAGVLMSACTTVDSTPAAAGRAEAKTRVLNGSVLYRERIVLPDSAKVRVQIFDGTPSDTAPKVYAETTFPTQGKQVPVPFALTFDPAKLDPASSYAVRAYILLDDKIAYVTRTRIHIDPNALPTTLSILVTPGTSDPGFADSPAPPAPGRGPAPSRNTFPQGTQSK